MMEKLRIITAAALSGSSYSISGIFLGDGNIAGFLLLQFFGAVLLTALVLQIIYPNKP